MAFRHIEFRYPQAYSHRGCIQEATMERLARLLGCVLLASLCVEAVAGTVKVAELTGAVRKGDGVAVDLTSTLNSGDRVLANSPDASVLLECTGGATQMLA